jgi:hypothetical protein
MKNKMTILLVLGIVLRLVGSVEADIRWCFGQGNVRDFTDPTAWSSGIVPTPGDDYNSSWAIMVHDQTLNVTTQGQGCGGLWLGYESGTFTLNIADGIAFHIPWQLLMGYGGACDTCNGTGVLNIGKGSTVDCLQLQLGISAAPYHGIINIADGGLLTVGNLGSACQIGVAGPGEIHMTGTGSMTTQTLPVFGASGSLDIEAGQLKVLGNYQTQLQGYVNNGRITSYGGKSRRCFPVVSFLDGYTYVKTSGCTCTAYLPGDLNRDCYVDMEDLAIMAARWFDCADASNTNCRQ